MYTDEQIEQLEEEERAITDAAIIAMIATLVTSQTQLERELRDFYHKYGTDGVVTFQEAKKWVSDRHKQKRLTVLLLAVGATFDSTLVDLKPQFKNALISLLRKDSVFFGVNLNVEDILSKKWGIDELTWLMRLENDVALWKAKVSIDIKQALLRGDSLDVLMKRIDKRFGSMKNVLTALGITESTAYGSLGRQAIFKELGIKEYRYYAKADERTCDICGSLHGLTFPMSSYAVGVNASPMHTRCRCWEVPVME